MSAAIAQRPESEPGYNFAYLDEGTKRMIRPALLKVVVIPAISCRSRRARCRYLRAGSRAGTAVIGPSDVHALRVENHPFRVHSLSEPCALCAATAPAALTGVGANA